MSRNEFDEEEEEEDETDEEDDYESDDVDVYDESDDYYSDDDEDSNSSDEEVESFKLKEHDDDDDVIFTKLNESEVKCKHCSRQIKLSKLSRRSKQNKKLKSSTGSVNSSSLDLLLFNYSREIYFYELNSIRSASSTSASSSDQRNLVDKKIYKTFTSTCFDINRNASVLNTLALQSNISPMQASKNSANNLNISPSNLSLIVAAGFSKGEIHVFDFFKKEASVFFNNSVNINIF